MARYLVDGMNVVGSRPDGWWRDRDAAVGALVRRLAAWSAATGEAVVAVFDGDPPDGLPQGKSEGVELVFAGRAGSADDEIALRAAGEADPSSLVVVTSDGELAHRVRSAGARVLGAGAFRRRLDREG
jgi:predicted RNA-binding protein with PIN domain